MGAHVPREARLLCTQTEVGSIPTVSTKLCNYKELIMGMFDTIRVKQVIKCPNCGAKCKEFQTKQLDCDLSVYKEGTTRRKIIELRAAKPHERAKNGLPMILVPTKKYHYMAHPKYHEILAYDYCKCEYFIHQRFRFDTKGRLKRIGQPNAFKR